MKILRLKRLFILIATLNSGLLAAAQNPQIGTIDFSVRSFWTYYAVPATIVVGPTQAVQRPTTFSTDDFGRLRVDLPAGEYQFSIAAPGFKPQQFHYPSVAQRVLAITIVLTPLEDPEEIRGEAALFRPGFTLISGWAVDTDGKPLANVHIRVEGGRAEEQTNARGYYALSVPSPPGRTVDGINFPAKGTVIAELPGYKTFVARNFYLPMVQIPVST
jgi:hypothetical protein